MKTYTHVLHLLLPLKVDDNSSDKTEKENSSDNTTSNGWHVNFSFLTCAS